MDNEPGTVFDYQGIPATFPPAKEAGSLEKLKPLAPIFAWSHAGVCMHTHALRAWLLSQARPCEPGVLLLPIFLAG